MSNRYYVVRLISAGELPIDTPKDEFDDYRKRERELRKIIKGNRGFSNILKEKYPTKDDAYYPFLSLSTMAKDFKVKVELTEAFDLGF